MLDIEELPADLRNVELAELAGIWGKLIEDEALWSAKLGEAVNDEAQSHLVPDMCRAWWGSLHLIIRVYSRAQAQRGLHLHPFPGPAFERLSLLTHELSRGVKSQAITDAMRGNMGRPMSYSERRDIAHAIFYIRAAKEGVIDDRSYNQTVRNAYNVTKRAVQRWCEREAVFCLAVAKPQSAKVLQSKMFECGERYSRIGRGAPSK